MRSQLAVQIAIALGIISRNANTGFLAKFQEGDIVGRDAGGDFQIIPGRHDFSQTLLQALRIYVNDELGELRRALAAAERILKPGGRLVVVTFHSLEDRIGKRFLTRRSGASPRTSRHQPVMCEQFDAPSFQIVNRRPLTSQKGELEVNPRARAARLRAALRTQAVAWPLSAEELEDATPEG